ncbi:MAG TPA: PQQ-dependent catabolism-associated CXXCW motif protein [Paracoccus sp. (in: a-proteobacteria)]|uniref:PQQ-dependent catabolism-associated CXXCW motif protein n=1 Tax=Paracoccus sp. TaxID=267 RepID=UPI002C75FF53|nr:PQQ-dependent catabolism-associated CXXCW motif protein [Paracoccus sp. (in: a-proteobacteria)]HWL57987.1 PQQ-dependent catabolism-associated CXXCW motif protein [Paracoccus sp. (in: a-proteobacteria)]
MKWLAAALIMLSAGPSMAEEAVPEPQGFHGEPYRSAVPATLTGADVITTEEAIRLHDAGVPFLDTMPRKKRPEGLPEGTIWNAPPHMTIPGATWLYDTGYDRIAPAEEQRLADGLAHATKGDKTAPVVIFCRSDCWMSWNAGKRAVGLGYTGVNWYPAGSDGWQEAGRELVTADAP